MTSSAIRTLAILLAASAAAGAGTAPLAAQSTAPAAATASAASPSLEFFGFRAGERLGAVAAHLTSLGGGPLRCDRARADARVQECRATLNDPDVGVPVTLWVSAVDSVASVLMLSGEVAADQLDGWRQSLQRRYGQVGARVQGAQWMMQWVRQGRMIRLTWRVEKGEKVASVQLVDGRVLDGMGRRGS